MKQYNCRARLSPECPCDDTERLIRMYKAIDPGSDPSEDGTYDAETESVVCDYCYIVLGMPVREELEQKLSDWHKMILQKAREKRQSEQDN